MNNPKPEKISKVKTKKLQKTSFSDNYTNNFKDFSFLGSVKSLVHKPKKIAGSNLDSNCAIEILNFSKNFKTFKAVDNIRLITLVLK